MCSHHFEGQEIDDTPNDMPEDDGLEDGEKILNLKTNSILKGMVELEHIFDHDEFALKKRELKNVIPTIWVLMKNQEWYRYEKHVAHKKGMTCSNYSPNIRISFLGAMKI